MHPCARSRNHNSQIKTLSNAKMKDRTMELTLERIAAHLGAQLKGNSEKRIRDVAPFDLAAADQITFADSPKYLKRIEDIAAGAVIVPPVDLASGKNLLIMDNPKVGFAKTMSLFHPRRHPPAGISSKAVIGDNFNCGEDVSVAGLVSIGDNVTIGNGVVLHPGVVLGDNVTIGNDTLIYPNVAILEGCRLGSRVIIHAGTVIGSDGYGFTPDGSRHFKIPQVGNVRIDDDVELGAVNTIDRATMGTTHICRGVKTDNQVHIGHNVFVGEDTLIVAQVIVGGSVHIGKGVIIAGGAAISDHVSIGDGAIVGPRAGIAKSVAPGEILSGAPEMPHRQWLKMSRVLPELPELKKRIRALEKRLNG